jgi:hypothetical protein
MHTINTFLPLFDFVHNFLEAMNKFLEAAMEFYVRLNCWEDRFLMAAFHLFWVPFAERHKSERGFREIVCQKLPE